MAFGPMALETCLKFSFLFRDESDWLVVYAGDREAAPDCIMSFARRLATDFDLHSSSKQAPYHLSMFPVST